MPIRKYYAKGKKTTYRKAKSTKKKSVKSKLTPGMKKEVKRLIHKENENKMIFTGASEGNVSNAPYSMSFSSWSASNPQGLPAIPIIQSIQHPVYFSADEQIEKGVFSGQRVGSQIRIIKLLMHYTISVPIQVNTNYGYRYKVKAVIYKNKDSNEPSSQFGGGLNGYDIFRNGLNITADTVLCRPSSTISDFVCPIDPTTYKVCYSEIFEITPPSFKDVNGDLENVSLSPVGYSRTVNCTKFIKKKLIYDNIKSGSPQNSCTNDNLYMSFFTCDDTGSKLDDSVKFDVVWNHYLEYEDS